MDEFLPLLKYSDIEDSDVRSAVEQALPIGSIAVTSIVMLLRYNFNTSETNYVEKLPFLQAITRTTLNAQPYIMELLTFYKLGDDAPVDRTISRTKSDSKDGSVTTKTKVATTPTLKGLSDDYVDEYSDTQSKSTGTSEETSEGSESISESVTLTKIIEIQHEHRDIVECILNCYTNLFYTYLS